MQRVDVLGDHRVEHAGALQRDEGVVSCIGLLAAERREALAVEAPEACGLGVEDVDVGDVHRIDTLPQPAPGRAEVGDPRGNGDAGAGEHDRRAGGAQELRQSRDARMRARLRAGTHG